MNEKLLKDKPTSFLVFTQAEKDAIENMKTILINPPILALSCTAGQYKVDTDASNSQVGGVLLQQQEDRTARPIGYRPRTLTRAKQNLETT